MDINNGFAAANRLVMGVGPAKIEKSRAVPVAMDQLSIEVDRVQSLVGKLIDRLSPLLSPEASAEAGEKIFPVTCEFAASIAGKAAELGRVSRRLTEVLDLLEI